MGKGNVNWEATETWQRVIAAMLAAGTKPDLKKAAIYFGTTYDTLENRFRKIKKLSDTLKEEVDSRERGAISPLRSRSTPSTPRKPKTPGKDPLRTVTNGRVSKTTPKAKKSSLEHEGQDDEGGLGYLTDFTLVNGFNLSLDRGVAGDDPSDQLI